MKGQRRDQFCMDKTLFASAAQQIGLDLTDEQIEAFSVFEESLYETNKVMNLTRVPREDAWLRHFIDSLAFQSLIPQKANVLDLGTGPGFPAWPLAIARPDLRVTAIDSNGKMLGFLRKHPLRNLAIVQQRVEEWAKRERFEFVTGRAVAPLGIQMELSAAFAKVGGAVAPMRTSQDRDAIEAFDAAMLGLKLESIEARMVGEIERLCPIFRKVMGTDREFPRRWSDIKVRPLS
ncbi:16S rRNA (guanine(527)-N(7))-methyltransferase RsmG [soil metagenome]